MSKQGVERRQLRAQEQRRELESAWLAGFRKRGRNRFMTDAESQQEAREYVDRTSGLPAVMGTDHE